MLQAAAPPVEPTVKPPHDPVGELLLPEVSPAARAIVRQRFRRDEHYQRFLQLRDRIDRTLPVDYLYAEGDDAPSAPEVFKRLRWGGQILIVSRKPATIERLCKHYGKRQGFVLEAGPASVRVGVLPLPGLSRRWHYMLARKVLLLPPGDFSDRFTFHVQLVRVKDQDEYVVMKRLPSRDSVIARLRQRFPDLSEADLEARSGKLLDRVFPIFLTREAAILRILQRKLPEDYRDRVPDVLGVEKGPDGLVRKLYLRWLRLGGQRLSQLEFSLQAADLLRVLHEIARVIHLDLRLDNVVITPRGVCFVDFGSAVRIDEDLSESPLLQSLFDEMMSTSQIQRVLGRMKDSGQLTSPVISRVHQKVDPAVDFFYLAVQINTPHQNPDFRGLVEMHKHSREARYISQLTDQVLRPKNPVDPRFRSAADVLKGLKQVEQHLKLRGVAGRTGHKPY